MNPQQQPSNSQQQLQTGAALIYGAAFMNHCMHSQLQQLADAQWKLELSAKLAAVLEKVRERFARSQNVCLCQTWVGAEGSEAANPNSLEVTLWADPRLAIVLDPLFQELRNKSCQGPVFFRNSMPGKVWRSGAVQIVQNLRILPPTLHPRSQLSEEALERLAEALYIPIYDLGRPATGQVCVLEVLLSTRATEAMLVADVISFIGSLLSALQLSLANPVQQPVRRSVLCGRRARAPDSDEGEASGEEGAAGRDAASHGKQQPQQQAQQQQQQQAGGCTAAHGIAGGAGPSMGQAPNVPGQAAAAAPHMCPQTLTAPGTTRCAGTAASAGAACAAHSTEAGAGGSRGETAAVGPSGGCGAAATLAVATGAPDGTGASRGPCGREEGPVPACSEQPTLPASPSHDRVAARAGLDAAAGDAAGPEGPGKGGNGYAAVPRKVRKLLDGPMQRTKSVVSVAALSDGVSPEDEDEDGGGDLPLPEELAAALLQAAAGGACKSGQDAS